MRKMLLPLLLLAFIAAPASSAVIHEGGGLIVLSEGPFDQSAVLGTDALVSAYSNISFFLGGAFNNGGATLSAGNTITLLVADDLVPLPAYGGQDVTSFKFTATNLNSASVTARPLVRFYLADGAGGAPGTFAGGFNFNPIVFPANTITTLTATLPPATMAMFGVPFWAGLAFDDNSGTTGATAAQLNNMGQGFFDPPTVGSSADQVFASSNVSFTVSNPAGAILPGNGQLPFNLGWEFNVDQATPAQTSSWGRLKSLYR